MRSGVEVGEWPIDILPPGWCWLEFGEFWLDYTDSKKKIAQKNYESKGAIAVIDQGEELVGGYTNDLSMRNAAPLPAIIFGDHTRAVKFIDRPFAQGADGVRVFVPKKGIEPTFAFQALRCVRLPDKGYSRHFKYLKDTSFPFPPPAEQRRIVEKIDSLTSKSKRAREQLDHVRRLVERYKQSILTAAFCGELTTAWRATRSSRASQWRSVSLAEIADVETGSTPKRGLSSYYEGGRIPWITSGAVNVPLIENADEYITERALKETNCKVFPAGTLVMAMYGEGQTRGRISTLGIAAATNQALAAICVHENGPALRNFVLWFLRSRYLELRQQAAGGVQPNLNLGIIKKQQLALPDHEEQCEIVRRIEHAFIWINRLAVEATTARNLVESLDQAILAKAFRGQLVPQDPNEESASVLLDRINAKRGAAQSKIKRRARRSSA